MDKISTETQMIELLTCTLDEVSRSEMNAHLFPPIEPISTNEFRYHEILPRESNGQKEAGVPIEGLAFRDLIEWGDSISNVLRQMIKVVDDSGKPSVFIGQFEGEA